MDEATAVDKQVREEVGEQTLIAIARNHAKTLRLAAAGSQNNLILSVVEENSG